VDRWQYLLVLAGCLVLTIANAVRFPLDIPIEHFLFGWALVTAVLLLWVRQRPRDHQEDQ